MSNDMHAYLITSPDPTKRRLETEKILAEKNIKPLHLTTLTIPASLTAHTIESIREIIHKLTIRITSEGEQRAILIEDAHLMTIEAQNAFLKTLEEPPNDTIIILEAEREDLLLPTIQSRCVSIFVPSDKQTVDIEEQKKLFTEISKSSLNKRIQLAEKIGKNREDAIDFVLGQLAYIHIFFHHPSPTETDLNLHLRVVNLIAKKLLQAHADLSHNVNPKMVLFELLHKYPSLL